MTTRQVLHVISDTDRRGAQVFAVSLCDALERHGWFGDVVAVAGGDGDSPLPVNVLGATRRLSARALVRLARRWDRYDAVLAHGSSALPACAGASAGRRTPFLYRNIGDPLHWASTPARRLRVRAFLRRAAGVAALWDGSATAIASRLGIPRARLRVIPNGVDVSRWPVPSPQQRDAARRSLGLPAASGAIVACVGALSREKNVDIVIQAVQRVQDAYLLVVGDGQLRAELTALAAKVLPERCTFMGALADPRPAFWAADVVAMPSSSEGLPAALIEAGLSYVPAVASDVGGVRQIVVPDVTGLLVSPDDPDELADSLCNALTRRDELGAAARTHCVATFDLDVVAAAYADFLDAVTAGDS